MDSVDWYIFDAARTEDAKDLACAFGDSERLTVWERDSLIEDVAASRPFPGRESGKAAAVTRLRDADAVPVVDARSASVVAARPAAGRRAAHEAAAQDRQLGRYARARFTAGVGWETVIRAWA
jgi:hypothetical protein